MHRKVFLELDSHLMCGVAGTGRSSSAEAAAKAIAVCTSSVFKAGKAARIFSMESPAAKLVQHRTKRNPCAPENRFAATNFRVPYDPVFVFHSGCPFHP
jgi:hypothetical protein